MGRASTSLSEVDAAIEFTPPSDAKSIDFAELFPRVAPVEVDLGCGDGAFLAALAQQFPERNYIGVERLFGRIRTACRRIARAGLTNARVTRLEIDAAVRLLPAESVDAFYVMFPDPWPKRRHQGRRVVTTELLHGSARALRAGGTLRLSTDQREYFEHMQRVAEAAKCLAPQPLDDGALPRSTFEQRYVEAGAPIYRLGLRKILDPR